MGERARLEIVLRGNTYGGSNPSLCATRYTYCNLNPCGWTAIGVFFAMNALKQNIIKKGKGSIFIN